MKEADSFLVENKKSAVLVLLVIVLFAIILRVINIGHVLFWDEAWNLLTTDAASKGLYSNVYFFNFWRHPPIYIGTGSLVALLTNAGRANLAIIMELLSILASVLTIILIYIFGSQWFSRRAGLLAAFIYALIPMTRVFDTWVKQDSLAVMFSLLFAMMFFKKKYVLAGITLGLALLSKETAIIIASVVPITVLLTRKKGDLKGLATAYPIAFAVSFWWYLFLSKSRGAFLDFFLGSSGEAAGWARPWYHYIQRLGTDLSIPVLIMLAVSIVVLFVRLYKLRETNKESGNRTPSQIALFLLVWITVTYLVFSLSVGKPYWMVYYAMPAVALISSWGMLELLGRRAEDKAWLRWSLACLLLAAGVLIPVLYTYSGYLEASSSINYYNFKMDEQAARYINQTAGRDARVLTAEQYVSTTFIYNLDCYDPASPVFSTEKTDQELPGSGIYPLSPDASLEEIDNMIAAVNPNFLVIKRDPDTQPVSTEVADSLAELWEPVKFGSLYLFQAGKGFKQ